MEISKDSTIEIELLKALETLYKISGEATIPMYTCHDVRKMGKFLKAREFAKAVIDKAKAKK